MSKMAQFDSLIILPLLWSLLLTLFIHYNIILKNVIPNFFGAKKFRGKKLNFSGLSLNFKVINSKVLYTYLS
jgi:hypothetical protein